MSQLQELELQKVSMQSVMQLTSAFEGIASMHIGQIKDQVQASERFFKELWAMYTQLKVAEDTASKNDFASRKLSHRDLVIVISSEGSLSGDIDQRLVEQLIGDYDPSSQDIIAVGRHGASLLKQRGVICSNIYSMPDINTKFDNQELLQEIQQYRTCKVYYQAYVSLMFQEVHDIELLQSVQRRGKTIKPEKDEISELNYIFEPSVEKVVAHLERSMMWLALKDVVLSSQLAQQASRFKAMSAAHNRAQESVEELTTDLSQRRRHLKDERTREIINGIRQTGVKS